MTDQRIKEALNRLLPTIIKLSDDLSGKDDEMWECDARITQIIKTAVNENKRLTGIDGEGLKYILAYQLYLDCGEDIDKFLEE